MVVVICKEIIVHETCALLFLRWCAKVRLCSSVNLRAFLLWSPLAVRVCILDDCLAVRSNKILGYFVFSDLL